MEESTSVKRRNKWFWPIRVAIVLVVFGIGATAGFAFRIFHEPAAATSNAVTQQPSPDFMNEDVTYNTADINQAALDETPFVSDYALPAATNGMAPVITRLSTKQPVIFLGIDDGMYKDPSVVQIMKGNHIKASLFLSKAFIANNPDFFKQLVDAGSVVENHTLNHDTQMIKKESYAEQKAQICGMSDYELQHFGTTPLLFRPPGGAYSDTMRKAAYDCGMKAIVTWIAKANGGSMQYQIGHVLRPGDIVLMHFRPEFKQDMQAFVAAENVAGLHTELIEDAIKN